ncbi:anaerobic sulfatase maturase [Paenibacillus sp. DMB20]|uniref:anaerobic sulfatase maturase n=1 Tax=Paenibacillus sp. DMB20 TaxID=1642570 RepID=UPI000627B167|nr:anaerobic sulfatase maturase [Paenibacillus sp. DMB20]KKO52412.1 radical SAM protein [Paenibacillus sp. DMB20]
MSTCGQTSPGQKGFGVMLKTVSEDCNLACDYCYYSTCGGKIHQPARTMEPEVLERFIQEYMKKTNGSASFAWQGGEPLLAGLPFFEQAVSFQASYAPPYTSIGNALQTNGTLIDESWAKFFRTYNFLVGVSLDGPKTIHDAHRVTGSGKGSFDLVMRGIRHLTEAGVDFNILSVIHEDNVTKPEELVSFYREHRFGFVQFIPCMDFNSRTSGLPGRFRITPQQYGNFLCRVFDLWYNDGRPDFSVRIFDNMLAVLMNHEPELCVHRKSCPKMMMLESNGDAYPCDFFMDEGHKLGNIGESGLDKLLEHPVYESFLAMKPAVNEACRACEFIAFCHGGCPRNRNWLDVNDRSQKDYFCESYQEFYRHAYPGMKKIADRLREEQLERYKLSGLPLPGRNEECFCGSGKKFKKCCGLIH